MTVSLICITLILLIAPMKEAASLYEDVIRMHILADSDLPKDQVVKLKVRDRILLESETLLHNCETREDAAAIIERNLDYLAGIARDVLEENGFSYKAVATLSKEYYETRDYEGFSLPAGEYYSFRICLGNAEGKNWWCVMFPRLCLKCAATPAKLTNEGLTNTQAKTVSTASGYTFRFKLLEWLGIQKK